MPCIECMSRDQTSPEASRCGLKAQMNKRQNSGYSRHDSGSFHAPIAFRAQLRHVYSLAVWGPSSDTGLLALTERPESGNAHDRGTSRRAKQARVNAIAAGIVQKVKGAQRTPSCPTPLSHHTDTAIQHGKQGTTHGHACRRRQTRPRRLRPVSHRG